MGHRVLIGRTGPAWDHGSESARAKYLEVRLIRGSAYVVTDWGFFGRNESQRSTAVKAKEEGDHEQERD